LRYFNSYPIIIEINRVIELVNATLASVTLCDKVIDVIRAEREKLPRVNLPVSSLIAL
jgi:hypothetical protein